MINFNNIHSIQLFLLAIFLQNIAVAADKTAEISIGERLFLETRFAQAYYANPDKADPALDRTLTSSGSLKSSFIGKTMNCRACHMVDEHKDTTSAGMRSYSDFAKRPPVPSRVDDKKTSGRNSMSMMNISIPHENLKDAVFHFDGEFNSMEDLVRGTLTGRNFGWLVDEGNIAVKHIAKIIRDDNGKGELAKEFGGSYRKVFKSTAKNLDNKFTLPTEYRIDVDKASNEQILNTISKLITAYVTDLSFAKDSQGRYTSSPYDIFIKKNNLPANPDKNESIKNYNQRLLTKLEKLKTPVFVTEKDYKFKSHKQNFVFSKKELQGMKLFFRNANSNQPGGNCASCHTAPHFSDFGFHNTGLAQQNYDEIHGTGAFMKISIPDLKNRNDNHNAYLPATSKHPAASSRFRSIASINKPGYTDLGLWNVFANPDMPAPQQKLKAIMCSQIISNKNNNCQNEILLTKAVAAFKTPVLRDLGHSNPYMHTGQFSKLEQVVKFYITSSILAKMRALRNTEAEIAAINLTEKDVAPLVAFLKSLNEDYE